MADPFNAMPLQIYDIMLGRVPELVRMVSGQADSVPPNLLQLIEALRSGLEVARDAPLTVVNQAHYCMDPDLSPTQIEAVRLRFGPQVHNVAVAALAMFEKHIDPAVETLTYRFRFCPRNEPANKDINLLDADFFGCGKGALSVGLIGEWRRYVAEWATLTPAARRELKSYAYWNGKRAVWPELSRLALFWTTFPTSSIAAERTFGVLRHVQSPLRGSQLPATVRREVMFRVNVCVPNPTAPSGGT